MSDDLFSWLIIVSSGLKMRTKFKAVIMLVREKILLKTLRNQGIRSDIECSYHITSNIVSVHASDQRMVNFVKSLQHCLFV